MGEADRQLDPQQLCIGLFVELDGSWLDHPFAFNRFKIKNEQQLETLRRLGLDSIRYDPERSDCLPLRLEAEPELAPPPPPPPKQDSPEQLEKRLRIERLQQIRLQIEQVEKTFVKAADALKRITRNVYAQPEQAFEAADDLVATLVDTALADGDVKIHAMSNQLGEDVYFHSLNVAVLAMILGNAIHLRREELHQLGLGALFHDIGQIDVPDAILIKKESLSKAEQAIFETHCRSGIKIGRRIGLSEQAMQVVAQHHERHDGSGYPERLQGNQICLFARIVAITNAYDNLCNPTDIALAMTPYEALSHMFAKQRSKFDAGLLSKLIHCLGVYPPGSLVQLSDQQIGLVMSVNERQPLKPNVMVYNADIPQEAALILDLAAEPALKIEKSLRSSALPGEVLRYLNPRQRVSYYFDRNAAPKRGK